MNDLNIYMIWYDLNIFSPMRYHLRGHVLAIRGSERVSRMRKGGNVRGK